MEQVKTDKAPQAIGPYSQAIKSNGFVFCSGQIPLLADGSMVDGDIVVQTEQVIRNMVEVLAAAGSSIDRVVKTTVFLSDMEDFARMNEVYERFFVHKPARAAIQAARLPKDVKVEIECVAVT